ncbi:MAG: MBL fold metallo-hydrolase [Candidatus Andersenbacteria bacterium]
MTKLTVVGSGNWESYWHQPAFVLQSDSTTLLIDCGDGTTLGLREAGIDPNSIDAVLLTHFHGDHVDGLPGFARTRWAASRRCDDDPPFLLVGPQGIAARYRSWMETTGSRTILQSYPVGIQTVKDSRFKEGDLIGDLYCAPFRVNHVPDLASYGWRITTPEGKTIVFCGDMAPDQAESQALEGAREADLLLIEAGAAKPHKVHLMAQEAIQFGLRAFARQLVLNHLNLELRLLAEQAAAETVNPAVTVATDGLQLDV